MGKPMVDSNPDAPSVIVFPPLLPLACIGLDGLLQWLFPLQFLAGIPILARLLPGLLLLAAGLGLIVAGLCTLRRHGTNVLPSRPALTLIQTGVFVWTRNPMYVGGTVILFAVALVLALDWLLVLTVASLVVLHFGIVRREEAYLERTFGDAYRAYRVRAPRYFRIRGAIHRDLDEIISTL